jgi:hypothetical protein
MASLLLDQVSWDAVVDTFGNIAVCQEPYAFAQDAACQAKLFQGELWFDTTQGVPYWQAILGKMPPLAYLKAQYIIAAELVPGVHNANVFIASISPDRSISGQIQIATGTGVIATNF